MGTILIVPKTKDDIPSEKTIKAIEFQAEKHKDKHLPFIITITNCDVFCSPGTIEKAEQDEDGKVQLTITDYMG